MTKKSPNPYDKATTDQRVHGPFLQVAWAYCALLWTLLAGGLMAARRILGPAYEDLELPLPWLTRLALSETLGSTVLLIGVAFVFAVTVIPTPRTRYHIFMASALLAIGLGILFVAVLLRPIGNAIRGIG